MQKIFVVELVFQDPGEIANQFNAFYAQYAEFIDSVISISNYMTASPPKSSLAVAGQPPAPTFNFHFLVTYVGRGIADPENS